MIKYYYWRLLNFRPKLWKLSWQLVSIISIIFQDQSELRSQNTKPTVWIVETKGTMVSYVYAYDGRQGKTDSDILFFFLPTR
jgi:hypothetical protein